MEKKLKDIELWNGVLSGERFSLEQLYRRHYKTLLHYGYRFTSDTDLIEDCIHDLFIHIFENKSLKQTEYVESYLLKSIRNLLFKHFASSKNKESIENIEFDLHIDDSAIQYLFKNDDESLKIGKELLSAYNQLSDKQKQFVYLRYVKELKIEAIALLLDVNIQSCKNISFRILSKLRRLMNF